MTREYSLSPGQEIANGRYIVEVIDGKSQLGIGGAGHVYAVRQTGLNILRALKVLVPEHEEIAERYMETFRQEVEHLSQLTHRNIIKIIDCNMEGEGTNGRPYFVMEYADGGLLRNIMPQLSSLEQLLYLFEQVFDALAYAHQFGMYHGDIKPSNILCRKTNTREFEVKVSDFGVSKLHIESQKGVGNQNTEHTLLWGTRKYAAPEIRGIINQRDRGVPRDWLEENFPTIEIYSLGVTLAELLSTESLNTEATDQDVSRFINNLLPNISAFLTDRDKDYLNDFFRALTAYKPSGRYQDVKDAQRAWLRMEPRRLVFGAIPELSGVGCRKEINLENRRVRLSDAAFEWTNHPAFQRLHNLNQLNYLYLVYPSARHTRFTHSIEAFDVARQLSLYLLNDSTFRFLLDEHDISLFLAASLLHDIGHYPLTHALEELKNDLTTSSDIKSDFEMAEYFMRYQFDGSTPLQDLVEKAGFDPQRLLSLIQKTSPRSPADKLIKTLLDGTIDIDKIAYLQMDSTATGVCYGQGIDLGGLFSSLRIILRTEKEESETKVPHLAVSPDGISAAESIIAARYHMYDRVYWHRTNRSIMCMLAYVVRKLFQNDPPIISFDQYISMTISMSDKEALIWLSKEMDQAIKNGVHCNADRKINNPISRIVHEQRQLHKRLITIAKPLDSSIHDYLTSRNFIQQEDIRLDILKIVERSLSGVSDIELADDDVLLDIPRKRLSRAAQAHDIFVYDSENRNLEKFTEYSRITSAIQEQYHERANRCRIFVSSRIADTCRSHKTLVGEIRDYLEERAERAL